jgi:hypothetical protein
MGKKKICFNPAVSSFEAEPQLSVVSLSAVKWKANIVGSRLKLKAPVRGSTFLSSSGPTPPSRKNRLFQT